MSILQCWRIRTLAVLLLAASVNVVNALSSPARPVRSLVHPATRSLEILPRQGDKASTISKRTPLDPHSTSLRHDDTFRLVVSAFDDVFYLHLRPNDDLIHPAARIVYYTVGADGVSRESHTEPLLRESVKAYLGHVIDPQFTEERLREDAARVVYSAYPESELGWARIMVHDQGDPSQGRAPVFEGAFTVDGVVHHIMTKDNYLRNKHPLDPEIAVPLDDMDSKLIIWRDSDIMSSEEEQLARTGQFDRTALPVLPASCAHDKLDYNTDVYRNPALRRPQPMTPWPTFGLPPNSSVYRRDDVAGGDMGTNYVNNIGDSSGCPTEQKVLYMGVAADCEYVSSYSSKENATTQILNNWNTASSLYKSTFNVSLGIVELQVQEAQCPTSTNETMAWNTACSDTITLNDRLSMFSQWRGSKSEDSAGLWHLMSGCPTGSEVGIAWLGVICQKDTSGSEGQFVSGTGVSTNGRTEWQVVAHEIGHNFGAIHDCSDGCTMSSSCCPLSGTTCNADSQFLMSPVSQASEERFSPCTLGNICSVLGGLAGNVDTACLVDASQAQDTISLQMCGNGIVEDGEDCDPGSGVTSSCCDAATCKFTNGAVCDPMSSPCCSDQCGFAPATQTCRAAKDDRCDSAEMCSGNSADCPTDVHSPDGESCGSDDLACASGLCTSVARQCQSVGASMNLTRACSGRNDNTCQISCQDPSASNQCILLSSLLVDGSPCGYGGRCYSGDCQSGGALSTVKAWYTQNLQIAIPVTVVAGLIVLAILYYCLRSCWGCMSGGRRSASGTIVTPVNPSYSRLRHERLGSRDIRAIPTYMTNDVGPYASTQPPAAWVQPGAQVSGGGHGRQASRSAWVDDAAYNGGGGYRS